MIVRAILSLTTIIITCFTLVLFTQPLPLSAAGHDASRPAENQSVSGQISSVGDAAFAINVTNDKQDKQGAQTVEFLVDDKTKVEGKLTIGAQAMVEYRSDSGKNIAVHVVVTAASGVNPS
jgi:hypothetical protein